MTASPSNPFQPPAPVGRVASTLPLLPEHRWGELKIEVANVVRGWNRRRMILTGSINAQILYDPNGHGERVYVNDELVATTSTWGLRLVQPRAEFFLEAFEHFVPACFHVSLSFFPPFRTNTFRLEVAGRTVYEE